MSATYCDFSPPRTSHINFGAWWGPYQLKVWGFLSNSFLALSFVLAISKLYKYNGGQMHTSVTVVDVFQSWSDMFLYVIRCILRQDELRNVILTTCAFCMLIFTCLYENIITSKLIVPDEDMRYENIVELTNNGYSIIVQSDNDITLDMKLPDSLNKILFEHFQKSGKSNKLEFDNVRFVFRSSADESYIVDLGNASLKYAWLQDNNKLMLSYNEKMLSKFHQIPCHTVRNPLRQSLQFVYFVNFLVFEQLELTTLLRDGGFIGWWFKLQDFSLNMHLSRFRTDPKEQYDLEATSYISNMNLVPVYSIWFALNLLGVVVLAGESFYYTFGRFFMCVIPFRDCLLSRNTRVIKIS
jgi:hypothetical protein